MRVVSFSGPKFCGKDTAAKGLFLLNASTKKNLFRRAPMAEGVKNICREMFGYEDYHLEDPKGKETKTDFFPFAEPRWPMMDIANWLRDKYGGDVHARRWERVAIASDYDGEEGWACHVMTDLRFPEELEMLKRLEACIIYVERSEAEENLRIKQESGNAMALNPSERHYKLIRENATHTIQNDSTIAHLHAQAQSIVRNHYGFWGEWPACKDVFQALRTGEYA